MAASKENPPAQNLASVLILKRKIAAKNGNQTNLKPPPAAAIGAYSNEKITYHQNVPVLNPQETTNTTEQPKVSRKTKQLEVSLLDKKMDEINRKQETKKNETLDTWKGFDSLNYGFNDEPQTQKSTPVPPNQERTSTPSPVPKTQSLPVKTPEKIVTEPTRPKSPAKEKEPRKETPSPQPKVIEKPPSRSPSKKENVEKKRSPSPPPQPKVIEKPPSRPPSKKENVEKKRSPSPPPQPKVIEKPLSRSPSPKKTNVEKKRSPSPPPQPKVIEKPPSRSSSSKQENVEKKRSPSPPPKQEHVKKEPSPPPPPSPDLSKNNPTSSPEEAKSSEQKQPKSEPSKPPTSISETIVPISSIISNPKILEKNVQPFEQPPSQISTGQNLKLFPDIRHYDIRKPRNAHKSIQRSMDRYRFHVW